METPSEHPCPRTQTVPDGFSRELIAHATLLTVLVARHRGYLMLQRGMTTLFHAAAENRAVGANGFENRV